MASCIVVQMSMWSTIGHQPHHIVMHITTLADGGILWLQSAHGSAVIWRWKHLWNK